MTDMHRDGFERVAHDAGLDTRVIWKCKAPEVPVVWNGDQRPYNGSVEKVFFKYADRDTQTAYFGWQAALRYRDEQEKQA